MGDKTDGDIILDYVYVTERLENASSWGAAVSALLEWKEELEREMRRRGLTVP